MALARIPRFLALPGPGDEAFIVRVQMVRTRRLDDEGANAQYDTDTRTIQLPRSGGRGRRLFLLYHELGHACEDYRLWLLQQLGEKRAE
jgi:hypothetical protein